MTLALVITEMNFGYDTQTVGSEGKVRLHQN